MRERIPYNKRIVKEQQPSKATGIIEMGPVDINAMKHKLLSNPEFKAELIKELRKELGSAGNALDGVGLPFNVVEQKIQEAVEFTREQEKQRYESGLQSLSEQLRQAKEHIKMLSDDLISKNKMLAEGKFTQGTVTIEQIRELLQVMLQSPEADELRPQLNDKVFIDPTGGKVLIGSEIVIEGDVSDRNVMSDLEKLRNLLGKK